MAALAVDSHQLVLPHITMSSACSAVTWHELQAASEVWRTIKAPQVQSTALMSTLIICPVCVSASFRFYLRSFVRAQVLFDQHQLNMVACCVYATSRVAGTPLPFRKINEAIMCAFPMQLPCLFTSADVGCSPGGPLYRFTRSQSAAASLRKHTARQGPSLCVPCRSDQASKGHMSSESSWRMETRAGAGTVKLGSTRELYNEVFLPAMEVRFGK